MLFQTVMANVIINSNDTLIIKIVSWRTFSNAYFMSATTTESQSCKCVDKMFCQDHYFFFFFYTFPSQRQYSPSSSTEETHCFFSTTTTWDNLKTAAWEFIRSRVGTLLLPFNVLNHIVTWQKVRGVLNGAIKSVQFDPSPLLRSIFPRIDECAPRPVQTQGHWVTGAEALPLSGDGHGADSEVRHRDAIEKPESS